MRGRPRKNRKNREYYLTVSNLRNKTRGLHGGLVHVFVVQTFGAHVFGKHTRVGSQPCDGDAHVGINGENLLLMGSQFGRRALQRGEDGVGGGFETNRRATLSDCVHGIFDLEDTSLGTPRGDIRVVLVSVHGVALRAPWLGEMTGLSSPTLFFSFTPHIKSNVIMHNYYHRLFYEY